MARNTYPISNLNLKELFIATSDTQNAIACCRQHGLLFTRRQCTACGRDIKKIPYRGRNDRHSVEMRIIKLPKVSAIRDGTFLEEKQIGAYKNTGLTLLLLIRNRFN